MKKFILVFILLFGFLTGCDSNKISYRQELYLVGEVTSLNIVKGNTIMVPITRYIEDFPVVTYITQHTSDKYYITVLCNGIKDTFESEKLYNQYINSEDKTIRVKFIHIEYEDGTLEEKIELDK